MARKKFTPENADLALWAYYRRDYFWIQGDTWHVQTNEASQFQILEYLSDQKAGKLINNLLDVYGMKVTRASRPFRSLWNSGLFGDDCFDLPQPGKSIHGV